MSILDPKPLTLAAGNATYAPVLVYSGGAWPARPASAVSVTWIGPSSAGFPAGFADSVDVWRQTP